MAKNKIALVTGGSRGLGKDIVLNLAKKGMDIIFTYHSNKSAAEHVIKEVEQIGQKAKSFQLDTRNITSFDDFFDHVTKYLKSETGNENFDFLINNAGTGFYSPIAETTEVQFDEMINIHLKGVYFFTQKALPYLNDGGGIINISSGLTRVSFPNMSAYALAKGAVEVFTRYLTKELGHRGIKANTIAPGAVATDFGGGANRDDEQKRKIVSGITALGRMGEPEDIGGTVAFLCTEEARWINGQRIEISGGMLV
ncbi:SDR family NAD(P)-dependent oxidoreductase [Flavivirga eckloniae]|uniref:Short-chain dehydrogenase n=1 Tax=Flavivirga eckloniae TaxID=1803846 RepID=A0A2K9PST5_9FLAO|nr:SDR family oxidoreductase [Flavivirga eckloniae]AUP80133.1 short-chain dehydrogenase [Flavivirga eckloniae]